MNCKRKYGAICLLLTLSDKSPNLLIPSERARCNLMIYIKAELVFKGLPGAASSDDTAMLEELKISFHKVRHLGLHLVMSHQGNKSSSE